jgi:Na+/proline symporter
MEIYLFIGIYVATVIGLSYYYSRGASAEDYLISGRDRNEFNILASKFAGAVGVSTFITYTGYAYRFGLTGVTTLIVGIFIGYNLFAFWAAPRIKRLSLEDNFYTQGDLPSFVTQNKTTGLFTNVITIVIQFFWILLSLVGGGKVIAYFDILPYDIALVLTAVVILIYVLISGFKAVIITDVFQTIIILILLGVIVYNLMAGNSGTISEITSAVPPEKIKIGSIIGLLLYGALSVFGLADRYQLCYAAKDERAVKRGMSLAVIPIIVVGILLMLVGLSVLAKDNGLDHDNAFIYAMENLLSPSLEPILLVLFFAGLMSSADTNIFAVASHTAFTINSPDKVKTTRITTIIVVLVATSIALFWKSIIDITIVGAALRLTLAVPMIYVIRGGNNSGRFIATTLGGIIALGLGLLAFGADPKLALAVLVGSLLGLIYKEKRIN